MNQISARCALCVSLVFVSLAGCGTAEEPVAMAPCGAVVVDGKADGVTTANVMPLNIVQWQRARGWGAMHVDFHSARRWDIMSTASRQWATTQNIKRAALQEGSPGSGLEFLAMHRVMISAMTTAFPQSASIFTGFTKIPTNPRDAAYPLAGGATTAFDPAMQQALTKLETTAGLQSFASDDAFALYLQTTLRPVVGDPSGKTVESGAGIHNYLHNRFTDSASPINVGNPAVNLENKVFWAIHGYIDARWTAYRAAKGLSNATDTTYQRAIRQGQDQMAAHTNTKADGVDCVDVPADIQAEFFAQ